MPKKINPLYNKLKSTSFLLLVAAILCEGGVSAIYITSASPAIAQASDPVYLPLIVRNPQSAATPTVNPTATAIPATATAVPTQANGDECVVTRSTATTPTFAATHPKVLLNHQPTQSCLQLLLTQQVTAATRFKALVDAQMETGDVYDFKNWYAALLYQLTGNLDYATYAITQMDAFVASEEALISQGERPTVSYDSYLEVGDKIGDVMLVYDWCYEHLTPAQRTRWLNYANQAVWNVWNHEQATWGNVAYPWSGWSVDNPYNNYYYSFLRATMLLGLASHGENAQAEEWIDTFRNSKLRDELLPAFTANLQGGGSREGTGYGTAMKGLFTLYDWWERSTGERIASLTPHTLESLPHMLHNIVPTLDRLAPTGDHARDSTAALFDYHREYILELMTLFPDERISAVAKNLLEQSSVPEMGNGFMYFADFLYHPPAMPSHSLTELSNAYWGSGTGQFMLRSGWEKSATFANFICGPYSESHAHRDQGSFVIFKGTWLAYDANIHSHSGIEQDEEMHNLVRIEQNGSTIRQVEGAPRCNMLALADNDRFSYALAEITPIYNGNPAVSKVEREFLLIKPDTFVVFDRVVTSGSGIKRIWTINTPGTPVINGDTMRYTDAGHQLDVYRLAPAGLSTEVFTATVVGEDVAGKRLETADSSGSQSLFLHVLTTDGALLSQSRSDANGQTGAQLSLADGRTVLVRFSNSGHGGNLEVRTSNGDIQYNAALPNTVTAPPLFKE